MFIDEITITIQAGKGGDGKVAFFPGKKSGPCGGNGGRGGDVFAKANKQMSSLNKYSEIKLIEAEEGIPGGSFDRIGANAKKTVIQFPVGTELIDLKTKRIYFINREENEVLLCRGGVGGLGNAAFKTATNRAPRQAEKGAKGEIKQFKIILKLIADYGLIGLPNAGKSSLLNVLTRANVKVAAYPFTTLEPNLGVFNNKIIADIPGLIEGASLGKGLGIKFLKHIEKVSLLLHCISCESADMEKDYQTVINELKQFNPFLLQKKQIILLTKTDLFDQSLIKQKIAFLNKFNLQVIPISIYDFDGLKQLKKVFV